MTGTSSDVLTSVSILLNVNKLGCLKSEYPFANRNKEWCKRFALSSTKSVDMNAFSLSEPSFPRVLVNFADLEWSRLADHVNS